MEDENSYLINIDNYFSTANKIIDGNDVLCNTNESEVLNNVNDLLVQLELKKDDLINRLINNDQDSEIIRTALRGEKEGIEYAIRAAKKFLKMNL